MNNGTRTFALTLAILSGVGLSTTTAQAMHHGEPPKFEEIDANGDGNLTQEEMQAFHKARMMKADTDGDGQISEAELRAMVEERAEGKADKRVKRMMEHMDADGSGTISADEIKPKRAGKMFGKMDKDGDGAVSAEEFEAMKEMRGKHKHGKKDCNDG